MQPAIETITITLPNDAGSIDRETRTVYAAPKTPDGTDESRMIRLTVDTPQTLIKDNDYREGAEFAAIDVAPFRFYGHVAAALQESRPTEFGWSVWAE